MCQLGKVSLAVLLALPAIRVLAGSQASCAPSAETGAQSRRAPSMVQQSFRPRLALLDAGGMVGAEEHMVGQLKEAGRLLSSLRELGARGNGTDQHMVGQLQKAGALLRFFRELAARGNGSIHELGARGNGTELGARGNGTGLPSGAMAAQLTGIRDVVKNTLIANLLNLTAEDQAEVYADYDALQECDKQLTAAVDGMASHRADFGYKQHLHFECRQEEGDVFFRPNRSAWNSYSALTSEIPAPPPCPTYGNTPGEMRAYFDSSRNRLKRWYEENGKKFQDRERAAADADLALQKARDACDKDQLAMEQSYCSYRTAFQSSCSTYDTCHGEMTDKYNKTKHRVMVTELLRKDLQKSAVAIICHLEVMLNGSKTHDECVKYAAGFDTKDHDIVYPDVPKKSDCGASAVASVPCDEAWRSTEYAGLHPNTTAAACYRCPGSATTTATTTATGGATGKATTTVEA